MTEEENAISVSSMSDLSEFEKGQVVGAYLGGLSVQDVSEMCNISRCTVSEILDTYKLSLELAPGLKKKSGGAVAMKTRKRKEAQNGQTREKRLLNEKMDKGINTKKTGIRSKAQPSNDVQEPTEDGQEK